MQTFLPIPVSRLSWLLGVFLWPLGGCNLYHWASAPQQQAGGLVASDQPRTEVWITSPKQHKYWLVSLSSEDAETLSGEVILSTDRPRQFSGRQDPPKDVRMVRLVLADDGLAAALTGETFTLPKKGIGSIQVYKPDRDASGFLISAGVLAVGLPILSTLIPSDSPGFFSGSFGDWIY